MKNLHIKSVIILSLVIVVLLSSLAPASAATNPSVTKINVFVEGKMIRPTFAPIIRDGKVYVEFRSIVQALGYSFKYDSAKKIITAESPEADFKIKMDLKTESIIINGLPYSFDNPTMIENGPSTLVRIFMFKELNWAADYNQTAKRVDIQEDLWGKPSQSDLKEIKSIIEKHYLKPGIQEARNIRLESWGSYVTLSADVTIRKSGDELLDRIDHATIEIEHLAKKQWTIHNIESDIEYLDYKSLAQKEATVPEADKAGILTLMDTYWKALNNKDAKTIVALRNPDVPLSAGISSKEQLIQLYEYELLNSNTKYTVEHSQIVSFQPNKALLYTELIMEYSLKAGSKPSRTRYYQLITVVKATDGNWHLSAPNTVLHYVKL
jgi:ketosteroid isomerase-like protein